MITALRAVAASAVRADRPVMAAGACGAVLLGALIAVANGDPAIVLSAVGTVLLLALVWFIPLRWTLVSLLVLGACLEAPYEAFAGYVFRTPLYPVGMALLGNLNLITRIGALKFSGFDVLMLYVASIHLVRRVRRNDIDAGSTPLPQPLVVACLLSAACICAFLAWGMLRNGDFNNSLWQVQKPFYIPLLVVLLHAGIRGSKDLRALGTALVVSAVYRAALAAYIHFTIKLPSGEALPYATTHADTMLFVSALVLLVMMRNERVPGAARWSRVAAAAIILAGMVFNGRRLVWVSLGGCLIVLAAMSPWTPLKRKVARLLIVASPFLAGYVAAGWNSGASLFAPVATIRSVIDSKSDASSAWRDLENMNLVRNIATSPFIGDGFGHEYVEYAPVADVSSAYPQYRYIPHNSVLALFAFTGPLGVAGIWSVLVATVFLAARAYRRAESPGQRAAALTCIAVVFAYVNQVYGDIGVSQWLAPLLVAPASAIAGKLAVETGAWRVRERRRVPSAIPALSFSYPALDGQ